MLESYDTFFFSGKGGVGKSTISSAVGVKLSRLGYKTLVVSLDPAHSLSLTFKRKIGEKPTLISENLYGIEIDPEREMKRYLERVKKEAREILSPVLISEVERQIELAYYSPGALHLATLDVVYRLAVSGREDFEKVVFDTAPSGFTVRMFATDTSEKWIEELIKLRKKTKFLTKGEKDEIVEILFKRLKKIRKLRELLLSPKTLFAVVVNPEVLPLEIGRRTLKELGLAGIEVKLIVGNKVKSEEDKRKIKSYFPKERLIFVKKFEGEPRGVNFLWKLFEGN